MIRDFRQIFVEVVISHNAGTMTEDRSTLRKKKTRRIRIKFHKPATRNISYLRVVIPSDVFVLPGNDPFAAIVLKIGSMREVAAIDSGSERFQVKRLTGPDIICR